MKLRNARVGAVACAFLLLTISACGSRVDNSSQDNSLGSATSTTEASGSSTSAKVGTLDNPCSADKASGTLPSGTPGVTADKVKIGVISDRKNEVTPVPTIGVEEAVKAFVAMCNDAGGVNGRQLDLVTYDSQIFKTDDVTKQACNDGLFALVGDGSVQDQQGIQTRIDCGLPEVAAYSATPERSVSENFFQPVPGTQPTRFNVGPCRYMAEKFPTAVKKAAVLYTSIGAAQSRGQFTRDACTQYAGFDYVVDSGVNFGETNYAPVVTEMKDKGVQYFTMVSAAPDTLAVLREMQKQDFKPKVIDLGQQYYDPSVAEAAAATGAYVLTNTTPFEEMSSTPALQVYDTWMKKVKGPETSLGVQAFSAGLLFATALKSLGNDITRENLVAALKDIHEWDGGGLQMTTDPGSNTHNSCFLYMTIKDGKFVRWYPDKGFSCNQKDVITTDKQYLTS